MGTSSHWGPVAAARGPAGWRGAEWKPPPQLAAGEVCACCLENASCSTETRTGQRWGSPLLGCPGMARGGTLRAEDGECVPLLLPLLVPGDTVSPPRAWNEQPAPGLLLLTPARPAVPSHSRPWALGSARSPFLSRPSPMPCPAAARPPTLPGASWAGAGLGSSPVGFLCVVSPGQPWLHPAAGQQLRARAEKKGSIENKPVPG